MTLAVMSPALEVALRQVEAFSTRDWDTWRTLIAPDAVYEEVPTGARITGPDNILHALKAWVAAYPDIKGTVIRAVSEDDTVAIELTWQGTLAGPLTWAGMTIPPNNVSGSIYATQFVTVRGGQVAYLRHNFDAFNLLRLAGVLKER